MARALGVDRAAGGVRRAEPRADARDARCAASIVAARRVESELRRRRSRPEGVDRAQLRQRGDEVVERIDRAAAAPGGRRAASRPAARAAADAAAAGASSTRPHRCGAHAQHARPAHRFAARRAAAAPRRRAAAPPAPSTSSSEEQRAPQGSPLVAGTASRARRPRAARAPARTTATVASRRPRLRLGQHERRQRPLHLRARSSRARPPAPPRRPPTRSR